MRNEKEEYVVTGHTWLEGAVFSLVELALEVFYWWESAAAACCLPGPLTNSILLV